MGWFLLSLLEAIAMKHSLIASALGAALVLA